MALLDWIVIGIFCCALIGIVLWVVSQKNNNSADYFLGGKDATWIAIGASIFASNIGSEHLIGLAGAGASSGMAMAHWEIQGWMILILGWVFVPFYTRSMVYTMPEFLERRYNTQSRTILSVISLISYVLTKVAVTVYAGGLVFQQVFGIKELSQKDGESEMSAYCWDMETNTMSSSMLGFLSSFVVQHVGSRFVKFLAKNKSLIETL